jgi:hypothetical protein
VRRDFGNVRELHSDEGRETGVGRRDEEWAQSDRRFATARVRKVSMAYASQSGRASSTMKCLDIIFI